MTTAAYPSFKCSLKDTKLIGKIVERAALTVTADDVNYEQCDIVMDLKACHCNGCKLDLPKLLTAPEDTFGHDVYGIRRFLSRTTGKMSPKFLPRCAK